MNKKAITWLIIGACLVLTGCILFGGVLSMLNWDFSKLSTNPLLTNAYTFHENIQNIVIDSDTADITLVSASTCTVTCLEHEKTQHRVTVVDGTLRIQVQDTRKWYEYMGISFSKQKITIGLPQGNYSAISVNNHTGDTVIPAGFTFETMDITQSTGDVSTAAAVTHGAKIHTSTGQITVEQAYMQSLELKASTGHVRLNRVDCAGDISITVSTGKVQLTDITCNALTSKGSTGDMNLTNVTARERFSITRSAGDIKLDSCDAGEIFIETDTGHITGSLLTPKIFFASSSTGAIKVPQSTQGGKCELTTSTGDIKIQLITQ